jgi:hypothetical protein
MKIALVVLLLSPFPLMAQRGAPGQKAPNPPPVIQQPQQPVQQLPPGQQPKQDQPKPKPKTERRKRADEKAEIRNLFTIEGKVKPADEVEIEKDQFGKETKVLYESEVRDLVMGDIVDFEKPNLQSKWNPDPITPVDVGWCYLVQKMFDNRDIVVQPRKIDKEGNVMLGKPFVIKGTDTTGLRARSLTPLSGRYKLIDTTKNKNTGTVFFVFELSESGSKKEKK